MVRDSFPVWPCGFGSPHACGDGPAALARANKTMQFSPRVWGWSAQRPVRSFSRRVLPTRVGMVRCLRRRSPTGGRSPHACGDGPSNRSWLARARMFSPRVWGWSVRVVQALQGVPVLPTRVGMVRGPGPALHGRGRSPHACGDGPFNVSLPQFTAPFSPRVWGWSGVLWCDAWREEVLPTRVGMVRLSGGGAASSASSPHACGDGPSRLYAAAGVAAFSPRVWGWSVLARPGSALAPVLPTRVGMVRWCRCNSRRTESSPHACGDGPGARSAPAGRCGFSPRVWGWSAFRGTKGQRAVVLPTRVGMVRYIAGRRRP